ncbi:MAG: superoxide dismutase family protein [Coprobacillaceae bacterium]
MNTFDLIRASTYSAPYAYASIKGGTVVGSLFAYTYGQGTILVMEAEGLPTIECEQGIHAVYIHEGSTCQSTSDHPFAGAGNVLNFTTCRRPYRTGDIPPLFSTNGSAWNIAYIGKFTPHQIVGRTVSIHYGPNTFLNSEINTTDPRIACGQIVQLYQ